MKGLFQFLVWFIKEIIRGFKNVIKNQSIKMAESEKRSNQRVVEKEKNRRLAARFNQRHGPGDNLDADKSTNENDIRMELWSEGLTWNLLRKLSVVFGPLLYIHLYYGYLKLGYDLLPGFFHNYFIGVLFAIAGIVLFMVTVFYYIRLMDVVIKSTTMTTIMIIIIYGSAIYLNNIVNQFRLNTVITLASPFCSDPDPSIKLTNEERKIVGVWVRNMSIDSEFYEYTEYCWDKSYFSSRGTVDTWDIIKRGVLKRDTVNFDYQFDGQGRLILDGEPDDKGKIFKYIHHKASEEEMKSHYNIQFIYAVARNHPEYIEPLIKRGADIDHQMKDGATQLIVAARKGDKAVVKKLIELGAETTFRDKKLMMAKDWARKNGHREVFMMLSEKEILTE